MQVTYKKCVNKTKDNRIEFLLIDYNYIDGNKYLAKLFMEEYGFKIEEEVDGLWYYIIRIRLEHSIYEFLWHEDTGNELYSLIQTEEENGMLQQRLEKILCILNHRMKENEVENQK